MKFNATILMQALKKDAEKETEEYFDKVSQEEKEKLWKEGKKHNAGTCLAFCAFLAIFILLLVAFMGEDESTWITLGVCYFLLIIGCIIAEICIFSSKYTDKTAKEQYSRTIIKQLPQRVCEVKEEGFTVGQQVPFLIEKNIKPYLFIDNDHKGFIIKGMSLQTKTYNFSDILDFEIYENNNSVVKGTAGKTLIGGAFFGLHGALIGGNMSRGIKTMCNTLYLIIRMKDIEDPHLVVTYVENGAIDKTTEIYKKMQQNLQEICSYLQYMAKDTMEEISPKIILEEGKSISKKEELNELKELLEDGLITQDEYEQKKKQILGL